MFVYCLIGWLVGAIHKKNGSFKLVFRILYPVLILFDSWLVPLI
jgi:hypothetical protein